MYDVHPVKNLAPFPKLIGLFLVAFGLGVVLAPFVALVALSPLEATLWHLRHKNVINCRGVRVTVPNGWYPEVTDNGCQLIRMRYTLFPWREIHNHLSVQVNVVDTPSIHDDQWKLDVMARLQREGEIFLSSFDVMVDGIPTICLEWSGSNAPLNWIIACNVDRRMVVTFFYDNDRWKPEFLKVLSGIRAGDIVRSR